ncbi:hypothetical protein [Actinoplanes sp. CA-252034]|uniref:hypothetical protein n=1 Tax=Actinoplanes sp. CA-252034 TaxID=3239906 RepID=UPI003D99B440
MSDSRRSARGGHRLESNPAEDPMAAACSGCEVVAVDPAAARDAASGKVVKPIPTFG